MAEILTSRDLEALPLYSIVHNGFSVWQKFGRGEWYEPKSEKVVRPHQIIDFCMDEFGHVHLTVVFTGYNVEDETEKRVGEALARNHNEVGETNDPDA